MRDKFSTKPIKIKLKDSDKIFVIPGNYFSPHEKNTRDEEKLQRFGFTLFLPNYEGFSIDMAEEYPKRSKHWDDMIWVLRVNPEAKFVIQDGKEVPLPPNVWGEPKALFKIRTNGLELLREEHDLKCYGKKSWIGLGNGLPCIGTRSNGELLVMWATDPPQQEGIPYMCDVRYYSEQEQLYIEYRFSRHQFAKWREIDDAIWAKLHAWQVK